MTYTNNKRQNYANALEYSIGNSYELFRNDNAMNHLHYCTIVILILHEL